MLPKPPHAAHFYDPYGTTVLAVPIDGSRTGSTRNVSGRPPKTLTVRDVTYVGSAYGWSAQTDENNTGIWTGANVPGLDPGTESHTVAVAVDRVVTPAAVGRLIDTGIGTGGGRGGVTVIIESDDTLTLTVGDGTTTVTDSAASNPVTDGGPHRVVVVVDRPADTATLCVDAAPVASVSLSTLNADLTSGNDGRFMICAQSNSFTATELEARVAEIRYDHRAWTPAEVALDYHDPFKPYRMAA